MDIPTFKIEYSSFPDFLQISVFVYAPPAAAFVKEKFLFIKPPAFNRKPKPLSDSRIVLKTWNISTDKQPAYRILVPNHYDQSLYLFIQFDRGDHAHIPLLPRKSED